LVSRLLIRRNFSFLVLIGLFSFILLFTACPNDSSSDPPPDPPPEAFYGTWVGEGLEGHAGFTTTMELSGNRIKITRTDSGNPDPGWWFQFDNLVWTRGANPRLNSVDYPTNEPGITTGYILTGTYHPDSLGGAFTDTPKFVGLSSDGTKILFNLVATSLSGFEHLYTR